MRRILDRCRPVWAMAFVTAGSWPATACFVILLMALVAAFGSVSPLAADEQAQDRRLYLPAVTASKPPPPLDCNLPGGYSALSVSGPPLTEDPETNHNLNMGVRGYGEVDETLDLVQLGPVHDSRAPQFAGMFGDLRTPAFTTAYRAYNWSEDCNCPVDNNSPWGVTVLGMGVQRGETIYTPDSGYDIGGDYEYLVLYAGESDLTLHIGREDEFFGYVLHIDGVCTDPELLALYRQLHAGGRDQLPALRGHQPFGVALTEEVQIGIRDWGGFLDPRSRNDWWQGR
ncbi:hypothetical protein [Candidatus Promineifilum breve]|nr:hypothetical protein [Candidatus Promineifilum breve]